MTATAKLILLNYVSGSDPKCVSLDIGSKVTDEQISFTYWLGDTPQLWQNVARDVAVDAARAMSTLAKKKDENIIYHPGDLKLVTLGFHGHATIEQRVKQSVAEHETFFLTAADWMIRHQNAQVELFLVDERIFPGRLGCSSRKIHS